MSVFRHDPRRRDFIRAGATAAAVSGAAGLAGCGSDGSAPGGELQIVVPDAADSAGDEYQLHVDGTSVRLNAHTPASRSNLAATRPRLAAGLGRHGVTHYAEGVDVPARAFRTHVTRRRAGAPAGSHELVLVYMNVDGVRFRQEMDRVTQLRDRLGLPTLVRAGWPGVDLHGEVISPIDTAAAICLHHPELMIRDERLAATVKAHVYAATGFTDLWSTIAGRPGTRGDAESWCEMVLLMDEDLGEPLLDENGAHRYDYKVVEDIMQLAGVVVREALTTTRNDEALRDALWREPDEGSANRPAQVATAGLRGDSAYNVVVDRTGSKGGITVRTSLKDDTERSVRIELVNGFLRYCGVYVTFHDENGQPIALTDEGWNAALPGGALLNNDGLGFRQAMQGLDLTRPTYRAATFLNSPTTVFGAPVAPGYREFFVRMPREARRFTLGLGSMGLGLFRKEATFDQEYVGFVLTAIVNITIPALLLVQFAGAESNQEEKDLLEAGEWLNIVLVMASAAGVVMDLVRPRSPESREAALVDFGMSSAKLLVKLGDKAARILLNPRMARFYALVARRIGLANLATAVPFVGWAWRALSVTATIAQLTQTIAEVSSSDASADASILLTLDARMEINPDLDNPGSFPARATSYVYRVTLPGSDPYDSGPQPFDGSRGQLVVRADRLPSGGTGRFSVVFYGADGREIVGRGEAAIYTVTRARLDGFVESATVLDRTRRTDIADRVFRAIGGQRFTTTRQLKDALLAPGGPLAVIEVDECLRALADALATLDIPLLVSPGKSVLEVECTIVEQLVALSAGTRYQHDRILQYVAGRYAWRRTATAPAAAGARCDNAGRSLCEVPSITLSRRTGDLGYAWRTASANLTVCGSRTADTQVYTLQNISIGADPNVNRKLLTFNGEACGVVEGVGVSYQFDGASDGSGAHFLLDGRGGNGGTVRVRPLLLSDGNAFELANRNRHYGTFSELPTSVCWHSSGFLIGVNRARHKMEILDLNEGLIEDRYGHPAELACGLGTRFGLLNGPSCVAVRFDGVVLVLESVSRRVQAFDVRGLPVKAFRGRSTPVFDLRDYGGSESYLDMSVEARGYVYVLSHLGDGTQASQYNLDLYTPEGEHLANTNGVTAARLIVDYWRNVHTLNREIMSGINGRTEPTVSRWIPA